MQASTTQLDPYDGLNNTERYYIARFCEKLKAVDEWIGKMPVKQWQRDLEEPQGDISKSMTSFVLLSARINSEGFWVEWERGLAERAFSTLWKYFEMPEDQFEPIYLSIMSERKALVNAVFKFRGSLGTAFYVMETSQHQPGLTNLLRGLYSALDGIQQRLAAVTVHERLEDEVIKIVQRLRGTAEQEGTVLPLPSPVHKGE